MTKTVTAAQAKAHLADCLRDVEQGEQVVITRDGKPVAVLVDPVELERRNRLRAASPEGGLAGLVGNYQDGPDFAAAVDAVVPERGSHGLLVRHQRELRGLQATPEPILLGMASVRWAG